MAETKAAKKTRAKRVVKPAKKLPEAEVKEVEAEVVPEAQPNPPLHVLNAMAKRSNKE